MLLEIDSSSKGAKRIKGVRLADFGLNERAFQDILFQTLDRLLPDDELLMVGQSRLWQEEPDLLAIDQSGRLFLFELKVWEAESKNLLQVFRYGQIYGSHGYEDLDRIFRKTRPDETLATAHAARFGVVLPKEQFNRDQCFVVLTNGIDARTREAIAFWRSKKLDVRPWVYRVYKQGGEKPLVEISSFRIEDNPYEDLSEGYFFVNTNFSNDPDDDAYMLEHKRAAAFYDPWKRKISRLQRGDRVFLYRSGHGIVAVGVASGKTGIKERRGNPGDRDEEYYMPLNSFRIVEPAIPAAEIREITRSNMSFQGTMFALDANAGARLYAHITAVPGGTRSDRE